MAEKTVTAKENGGKDERKAERVEMAEAVWRNVLDSILTFAELIRGYSALGDGSRVDFSPAEISAVLRLLVLGSCRLH
jgi:hypothetical protein